MFYYHHWAQFLKTESLVQISEIGFMGYKWSNIRKKVFIKGPLEVLRFNDFPKPFTRCKMFGFVVNQTCEVFSSVLKFLENGFVIEQEWRRSKTFWTLQ